MLVGSYSSNYYGIPRATKDADFVEANNREGIRNVLRSNEIRSSSNWPEDHLTALEERGIHR